jgi:hypothetical protein
MTVGVWAELMSDERIHTALPELAAAGARLHVALDVSRIGDDELAALTREASRRGVGTWLWPLLPKELGYWIGEANAEHAARALDDIRDWCSAPAGPAIQGVSIDLEPDYAYSEELRSLGGRPDRLLACLARHVNPARHAAARDVMARAVERTKQAGLRVHAVTYPLILDGGDGTTLEDALDIVVADIDWDEVSFMVYQTAFRQLAGTWFGPRLVYEYAKEAVSRFGSRAGLDLGVVGDAGIGLDPGGRYHEPTALHEDVRAGIAAGIPLSRMRVYGLDGILSQGGIARWLPHSNPGPLRPEPSNAVTGLRHAVRGVATGLRVFFRA